MSLHLSSFLTRNGATTCTRTISDVFQTKIRTLSTTGSFDKVGLLGLGLMGHGIAQMSAISGVHSSIIAYEPEEQYLHRGRSKIEMSIGKLVSKQKLTEDNAQSILNRITYTTDMQQLADADFIVEAVSENKELKEQLYKRLGQMCQPETIFATNTTSLSITEMSEFSGRPEKFVGVHFFNPVQIMKLVEVIRTEKTDPIVFDKAYNWVTDIKMIPVSCGDTPGFIVGRLLLPSLMQGLLMIDRGDASVKDIDISMQLGAGHPMGPIHLSDYIGLDTLLYSMEGWKQNHPNEPAFVVPKCLKEKVTAGDLGRKTGKGFYYWDGDKRGDPV
jgi:3-hydroxyacyl-CoA dehydrogenase